MVRGMIRDARNASGARRAWAANNLQWCPTSFGESNYLERTIRELFGSSSGARRELSLGAIRKLFGNYSTTQLSTRV